MTRVGRAVRDGWAVGPCTVLLAATWACSETNRGGLLVVVQSDGTLSPAPDMLQIQLGSTDGGSVYRDAGYPMGDAAEPGVHSFPVQFLVDSNGNSLASVGIVLTASNSGRALETQRFVVNRIPTDRFVELDVDFSQACASDANACCQDSAGSACQWSDGACVCMATGLPDYSASASSSSGALGGAAVDAASADANVGEGDASEECGEAGVLQCGDSVTPQECGPEGQWQNLAACAMGLQYCLEGRCFPLPTSCTSPESLCFSLPVAGGTFLRGNDPLHEDAGAAASVSPFRMDDFEIPVFRFRSFVNEVVLGAGLPDAGAGVHGWVAGGIGLNGGSDGGVIESGWDPAWNSMFPTQEVAGETPLAQWNSNLMCGDAATWSQTPSTWDADPINCVTWYEAYAFCIWDGGVLPSEAEWNFAAAGGSLQRLYPWGSADPASGSYANYGCLCSDPGVQDVVAIGYALGVGLFGQYNLAGNVAEWTLDYYEPDYPIPCTDCAGLIPSSQRVFRGGDFAQSEDYMYTSARVPADPTLRSDFVGFRCARAP